MIRIDGKTIKISRGDSGFIKLTISLSATQKYEFQIGDKVQLRILEKKNYDNVVIKKEVIIQNICTEVEINLEEQDTTIGDIVNKPQTFWYEVSLNEIQTVVGYDDDGPAEFIVYPANGGVK